MLQLRAPMHLSGPFKGIDGCLMLGVVMRLGLGTRWQNDHVHANSVTVGGLGRYARKIIQTLLTAESRTAFDNLALLHHVPPVTRIYHVSRKYHFVTDNE